MRQACITTVTAVTTLLLAACPPPPHSHDVRDSDESANEVETFDDPDSDVIVVTSEVVDDGDVPVVATCLPTTCPDDGNPCTDAACDSQDRCIHVPNLRPCDDGASCTVDDRCTGGTCVGRALDCDDREQCTDDFCEEGSGCVNAPRSGGCDDDDACTVEDACDNGACVGVARVCPLPADSHGCAIAECDARSGCSVREGSGGCDDDDLCTTGEACDAGRCVGTLIVCDDGDACTDDYCDPASGCTSAPNRAPCDDADECTVGDRCDAGSCQPGPATGCCDEPDDCDDGDACTSESCVDGLCERAPTCVDTNACTIDTCNAGVCAFDASPSLPAGGIVLAGFESALGDAWSFASDNPDVGWQRDDTWSTEGTWSLYVGKVPDYSYDFGATRAIASWTVTLPIDGDTLGATVAAHVAETSCSYDALVVAIDGEALTPRVCGTVEGAVRWDVHRWAGQRVTIDLVFDTVDADDNDAAGIWIDALTVIGDATPICCQDGVVCP